MVRATVALLLECQRDGGENIMGGGGGVVY
ncbi:hypothetical protein HmCmsJML006_03009 [Escherichia coli]|nr:hypothetical protein HmCmsJML006_03009 [Escherichia coli]